MGVKRGFGWGGSQHGPGGEKGAAGLCSTPSRSLNRGAGLSTSGRGYVRRGGFTGGGAETKIDGVDLG